ncbi:hypothetical protein [Acetobacterium wieringae]|uniref:hypothetical protein n=1 Tax=Acetobacterium wieringae TaxID=52694 RepID=UPI0026EFC1ED|nr:hypothetical protein [Acetobacterium wieringae]
MKKNLLLLLPALPYLVMTAVIFFVVPMLEPDSKYFQFFMLLIIPGYCLIAGFLYGFKNGIVWFYPLFISIIFLPLVASIIGVKVVIYGCIYGSVSLVGMILGNLFKKKKDDDFDAQE